MLQVLAKARDGNFLEYIGMRKVDRQRKRRSANYMANQPTFYRQTSGDLQEHGFTRRPSVSHLVLSTFLFLSGCMSIHTKIQIDAPAKNVRDVLLDFSDYPQWNPFIVKVDGDVAQGNTVRVTVKPVGKDLLSGNTLVTSLTETRLAWTGTLALPGLFKGKHEFIIEDLGANKTMFYQNEKMSGIVVLFSRFTPEAEGFVLMNEQLKSRAEKATAK